MVIVEKPALLGSKRQPRCRQRRSSHPRYQVVLIFVALSYSQLLYPIIPPTAIELLVKRVRARIGKLFPSSTGAPQEVPVPIVRPSTGTKYPQDIVEMIIANLIYDTHSLLACSLTCYSWYIASVPHLHHTLVTRPSLQPCGQKYEWPKPLQNASELNLLPLVKKLQIPRTAYGHIGLSPKWFDRRILRQFSGLTNVRELEMGSLDIPSFLPKIRRYFKQFLPTVRSLCLTEPKGSRRQIIFFIGLFEHLEDLTLLGGTVECRESEPTDDPTLVPPSTPPLRGRLVVEYFRRPGFLGDMISLFGGIRFRYMSLYCVNETRLLLEACANTLETLRLYPTDPCGE